MDSELAVRLGFYFGVFAVMAGLELRFPRRRLETSKSVRWLNNLAVTFLGSLLVRLLLPLTAIEVASLAAGRGWGLFNTLPIPGVWAGIASVFLLDLLIWAQHVLFHLVRPFWKLHMMHHADMDIDVTTGARFHPVEIILSMFIKITAILLLGIPAWSVLAFEVILNGTAMFNHSNVRLPLELDRVLRAFIVTPDMHRVHHSVIIRETNSNYGFNLSVWDRLFGTYRPQPARGHLGMRIGLANFRDPRKLTLPHMLAIPFAGKDRWKDAIVDLKELFRPVATIPAARVKERLNEKADDDFVLLDVREPGEYAGGHLPGAVHIPLSQLAGRLDELDRTRPVITYWKSGKRSRSAASLLSGQGFDDVRSMSGGIDAWEGIVSTGPLAHGMELLRDIDTPSKVLTLALALEEGSGLFYAAVRDLLRDDGASGIFSALVQAEESHKRTLMDAGALMPDKSTWQEYMEGAVKVGELVEWTKAPGRSAFEILDLSMQVEANSLDFYLKIAGRPEFAPFREVLGALIEEEKHHLRRIAALIERDT